MYITDRCAADPDRSNPKAIEMQTDPKPVAAIPNWQRIMAVVALVFGILTIVSGGSVLFGPESARESAGNFVPLVLWFNFLAGFAYFVAAIGIWLDRNWALPLSLVIALATLAIALVFLFLIFGGRAFEMRTVGALALRTGVWAAISYALYRRQK